MFQNYLTYEKVYTELIDSAMIIQNICNGRDTGEVTKYENGKSLYVTK